jgi:uncharacterized membrane protein YccC
MFRSLLLNLVLAGTCAAQPPSRLDRLVPPTRPDFAKDRRRLIEHADVIIPLIEDLIRMNENAILNFGFPPEQVKELQEEVIRLRKDLQRAKAFRQELVEQEANALKQRGIAPEAQAKPLPLAPMPREKRTD